VSFVWVTHESRPGFAYLAPEHYLEHPVLGRGLSRATAEELETDKAVVETAPADPPVLAVADPADEASITDEENTCPE